MNVEAFPSIQSVPRIEVLSSGELTPKMSSSLVPIMPLTMKEKLLTLSPFVKTNGITGRAHHQRVSRACTTCIRSKMRCDRGRPCQRCVRRGNENGCIDRELNTKSTSNGRGQNSGDISSRMAIENAPSLGSKRLRGGLKACVHCQRLKTSCDGQRPCLKCDRMGVPCVDKCTELDYTIQLPLSASKSFFTPFNLFDSPLPLSVAQSFQSTFRQFTPQQVATLVQKHIRLESFLAISSVALDVHDLVALKSDLFRYASICQPGIDGSCRTKRNDKTKGENEQRKHQLYHLDNYHDDDDDDDDDDDEFSDLDENNDDDDTHYDDDDDDMISVHSELISVAQYAGDTRPPLQRLRHLNEMAADKILRSTLTTDLIYTQLNTSFDLACESKCTPTPAIIKVGFSGKSRCITSSLNKKAESLLFVSSAEFQRRFREENEKSMDTSNFGSQHMHVAPYLWKFVHPLSWPTIARLQTHMWIGDSLSVSRGIDAKMDLVRTDGRVLRANTNWRLLIDQETGGYLATVITIRLDHAKRYECS